MNEALKIVLTVLYAGPLLFLLALGLVGFGSIARAGKLPWFWPWDTFRVYHYAFTTMRRSRETKRMLVGFLGAIGWAVVFPIVVALILGTPL
jgi:hypothetical protein